MSESQLDKPYRVFVYGSGHRYNDLAPIIKAYDGNEIVVLGIITTNKPEYKNIDGYACFMAAEVVGEDFDYVIITPDCWKDIIEHLRALGVPDSKFVLGKVFKLPYFSPKRYLDVKNRNISIFSCDCLAGIIYNELGLKVLSPTYNCFCNYDTFYEFMINVDEYLNEDMEMYSQEKHKLIKDDWDEYGYIPKGVLKGHNNICWYFNHTDDIDASIKYWNIKRRMVNRDEMFAICYIHNESQVEKFMSINVNKIGFSSENYHLENVIYFEEWSENLKLRRLNRFEWSLYIQSGASNITNLRPRIDWIRLLSGDNSFLRY